MPVHTNLRIYTCFLSLGVAGGIILDGLISIKWSWRVDYYVATVLIGICTLFVIFSFPETTYIRSPKGNIYSVNGETRPAPIPPKKTYAQSLTLFWGTYTN